jgi:D-3-phosphoglycerate dehydrogenase/C-terminal binding protein
MRILMTDRHLQGNLDVEEKAAGEGVEFETYKDGGEVPVEAWSRADAVVTYRSVPHVMAAMEHLDNCRIIVRGGVGFDGLDLAALGARDIAVCTVPDYGTTEVADHAMALLLALRRGVISYHDALRADPTAGWKADQAPCLQRLRGTRMGVLGLGRIGLAAARRARAFDMEVQFYDPHLPDGADLATGYRRLGSAEELFETSDAITIHTPLTDETRGMVNADRLARLPDGAVIVNTARGPVVDVDAIYEGLKAGKPAGAALDVLPIEPPDESHPLIKAYRDREPWLDGRFILTPHAAFFSKPGLEDLRRKTVETVVAYLRDGRLRNVQNAHFLGK